MKKFHTKYSSTTKSLQFFRTAITNIASTGALTDNDILSIRYWMDDNKHLSGNYPFDKIYSLIEGILDDGVIDPEERQLLLSILQTENIYNSCSFSIPSLAGCHVCLTGTFTFAKRSEIENKLFEHCSLSEKNVNLKTDYLFVGGLGSDDWAYGNYGNKIKKAKELQERGHHILIFGEDILKEFLDSHTPPNTYTFEQCLDIIIALPDEAQKIIQKEIDSIISGSLGFISDYNQTVELLISKNILRKVESDAANRQILLSKSRNTINARIEALNLGIPFKKNMTHEALIAWCYDNIAEHIKELFPETMILRLHDCFLNPNVLARLQQYFVFRFPNEWD